MNYADASELKEGDKLQHPNGYTGVVKSVRSMHGKVIGAFVAWERGLLSHTPYLGTIFLEKCERV